MILPRFHHTLPVNDCLNLNVDPLPDALSGGHVLLVKLQLVPSVPGWHVLDRGVLNVCAVQRWPWVATVPCRCKPAGGWSARLVAAGWIVSGGPQVHPKSCAAGCSGLGSRHDGTTADSETVNMKLNVPVLICQ